MSKPVQEVAIALVHRQELWLVARRPPNAHLGNLWEFPGGKCEPDEAPEAAAVRELREECGVHAQAERVLQRLTWEYDDRIVHLTPVLCRWQAGEAQALASEECRWVSATELRELNMPRVNVPIVQAILTEQLRGSSNP